MRHYMYMSMMSGSILPQLYYKLRHVIYVSFGCDIESGVGPDLV